jgi:hypothetical protein
MPRNYAQFLNYSAERRLLQRIGGRYRFIHRALMKHLQPWTIGVKGSPGPVRLASWGLEPIQDWR